MPALGTHVSLKFRRQCVVPRNICFEYSMTVHIDMTPDRLRNRPISTTLPSRSDQTAPRDGFSTHSYDAQPRRKTRGTSNTALAAVTETVHLLRTRTDQCHR